jgi:hypothetical protein
VAQAAPLLRRSGRHAIAQWVWSVRLSPRFDLSSGTSSSCSARFRVRPPSCARRSVRSLPIRRSAPSLQLLDEWYGGCESIRERLDGRDRGEGYYGTMGRLAGQDVVLDGVRSRARQAPRMGVAFRAHTRARPAPPCAHSRAYHCLSSAPSVRSWHTLRCPSRGWRGRVRCGSQKPTTQV